MRADATHYGRHQEMSCILLAARPWSRPNPLPTRRQIVARAAFVFRRRAHVEEPQQEILGRIAHRPVHTHPGERHRSVVKRDVVLKRSYDLRWHIIRSSLLPSLFTITYSLLKARELTAADCRSVFQDIEPIESPYRRSLLFPFGLYPARIPALGESLRCPLTA